jgi:hypothetical protein
MKTVTAGKLPNMHSTTFRGIHVVIREGFWAGPRKCL